VKLAVVLVVMATRVGFAQPDDEGTEQAVRARDADRAGRDHYAAHDFAEAVEDYRRAHDALPDPLFLFDMAQSYRKLHRCAHAAEMYRAYLKDLPNADNRRRVEEFIVDMDACSPHAPIAAPVPHADNRALLFTGIGTAALGLVLVGVGVSFSVAASDDASMIESMCAHGCRGVDVANLDQAGHESNRDAAITYALGGAALAAGAGMLLWEAFGASSEPPVVVPVAGGATVSGRFRF